MPNLLFVAYGGGHVAMLIPVAQRARELGINVIFLGLTTARAALQRAGIDSIGFNDLWAHAAPGAREFGRVLCEHLPSDGAVAPEESEAYLGISFADLAGEHGVDAANRLYAQKGRHAFLPVAFMERVIASLRPDLVVATNSPRAEQAALLASGNLGVRSLCLVDLFALQEYRWIGQPGYATRVCVLNEQVRQMLLDCGRSAADVVVSGNPAFDRLTLPEVIRAGMDLRIRRGWDTEMLTILWASQVEPSVHPFSGAVGDTTLPRRVESELRSFVRSQPGFRLVVRYHPSECVPFVPCDGVEFSPLHEPLPDLLHAVDIVVVTASTVGLEASLAGAAVVSVDCSVFTADAPYSTMGISVGVKRPEDLAGVLLLVALQCRAEPTSRRAPGDGGANATERVVREIESLVHHGV